VPRHAQETALGEAPISSLGIRVGIESRRNETLARAPQRNRKFQFEGPATARSLAISVSPTKAPYLYALCCNTRNRGLRFLVSKTHVRHVEEPPQPRPHRWRAHRQLVESKRVDGESRQRVLAHLGSCREPVDTLRHRLWFYECCERALDRLALAPEDRAKVDAQLAARLPPLSDEEHAQRQRERAILMATFGRPDGFARIKGWNAANEEERCRFLDELRKAEEARAAAAVGTEAR
jgi:hypothetical protein